MIQKPYYFMSLLIMAVFLYSCDDDKIIDGKGNPPDSLITNDCFMSVAFDVETITHIRPLASEGVENYDELARPEQVMLPPSIVKCHIESCINEDGTTEGFIQMLPANIDAQYPERAAGTGIGQKKLFDRAEFTSDGSVTYFNEAGEVVNSGFLAADVVAYQALIDQVSEFETITEEQMDLVIQAFIDEGFEVETEEGSDLAYLKQPLSDGYSKVILDKRNYAVRGQENYDANGNLSTSYNLYMKGEPDNLTITGHQFKTFFESPFSNVKMSITRRSIITNYVSN